MTIEDWLNQAQVRLEKAGVGTARLDALVLLEDTKKQDRAWLLARLDQQLSSDQIAMLTKLLKRRADHEPLAYLRKKTEFYGREFVVTPAVLEPRPESETMINLLKELPYFSNTALDHAAAVQNIGNIPIIKIADVGAGSGALGITAKLELPESQVELLEIDRKALKVAKKNVDIYTINISVVQSNLLSNASHSYDILLCNLPYVPDNHQVNEAALWEPKIAIFGGSDGLSLYRELFDQLKKIQKRPLFILTEALPPQHAALTDIAQAARYQLIKTDDFIQVFKNI